MPGGTELKLTASTPPEVFDLLSAQCLQNEGIVAQAGGALWCTFCETPVLCLHSHLGRPSQEATQHWAAKESATVLIQQLRSSGWKLRREGLRFSKFGYSCGLCNSSGKWRSVFDHQRSERHTEACRSLSQSSDFAVATAAKHNSAVQEEEKAAWAKAFSDTEVRR